MWLYPTLNNNKVIVKSNNNNKVIVKSKVIFILNSSEAWLIFNFNLKWMLYPSGNLVLPEHLNDVFNQA